MLSWHAEAGAYDCKLVKTSNVNMDTQRASCEAVTLSFSTPSVPNYNLFDFFNPKVDHLSYSKNCVNIVKFKLFLKNFY